MTTFKMVCQSTRNSVLGVKIWNTCLYLHLLFSTKFHVNQCTFWNVGKILTHINLPGYIFLLVTLTCVTKIGIWNSTPQTPSSVPDNDSGITSRESCLNFSILSPQYQWFWKNIFFIMIIKMFKGLRMIRLIYVYIYIWPHAEIWPVYTSIYHYAKLGKSPEWHVWNIYSGDIF